MEAFMKKLLSLLLALTTVLSVFSFAALANDEDDPTLWDGRWPEDASLVSGVEGRAYYKDNVMFANTDGIDTGVHTLSAGEKLNVFGGTGAADSGNDGAKRTIKYNGNTWIYGYAVKIEGVGTKSVTASLSSSAMCAKYQDNSSAQYTGDFTMTFDGDGVYAVLVNGYFNNSIYRYVQSIQSFSMIFDTDVRVSVLAELEGVSTGIRAGNNGEIRINADGFISNTIVTCHDLEGNITQELTVKATSGFGMGYSGSVAVSLPAIEPLEDYQTENKYYKFMGWSTEKDGEDVNVSYAVGTMDIYPVYTVFDTEGANVVIFLDEDGSVLDSAAVKDGEKAEYTNELPEKLATNDNNYVFAGWQNEDGDIVKLDEYTITKNETLRATYSAVPKAKYIIAPYGDIENGSSVTFGISPINVDGMTSGVISLKYDNEIFTYKSCDDKAALVSCDDGELTLSLTAEAAYGFTVSFDVSEDACSCESAFVSSGTYNTDTENTVYEYTDVFSVSGILPGIYAENDKSGSMVPVSAKGSVTLYNSDTYGKTATRAYTLVFKVQGLDAPLTIGKMNMVATKKDGTDQNYWWSTNWTQKAYNYPSILTFPEDGIYYYTVNSILGGADTEMIRLHSVTASNMVSGDFEIGKSSDNRNIAVATEESAPLQNSLNQNATLQIIAVIEGPYAPEISYYNAGGEFLDTSVIKYNDRSQGKNYASPEVDVPKTFNDVYPSDVPTYSDSEKDYMKYVFTGWEYADGTPATVIYKSAKVYAAYDVIDTRPDCNIKFVNYDDSVISDLIIKEGEMPAAPAIDPTKPHEELYSYIFQGWDADGDGEVDEIAAATVDGATYKAVYKQVDRRWEVKFYAEDKETYLGFILVLGELKDGKTPVAPEKMATAQYTYTFDKWVDADGNELVETEVTFDTVVYATYKKTVNQYTVTFLDEEGAELGKVTVDYGTEAVFTAPAKASDEYYVYTFDRWSESVADVTEDMTVSAIYSKRFCKFSDVSDQWFAPNVEYAVLKGYMSGMSDTVFSPNGQTTRAQLVQVLYNMEGKPDVSELENPFTDVAEGQWYTNAIKWAYSCGVVAGMTETTYQPNTPISREQFCAILYRYSENVKGYDMEIPMSSIVTVGIFTDKNSISPWATASVKWCLYVGCISGYTEGTKIYMRPKNTTTRAEMATILKYWETSDKIKIK